MLVRLALALLSSIVLAQAASSQPIAWVRDSRYTKGNWFDEQYQRELSQGQEIYTNSRIVRRGLKSRRDVLALRSPDGSPVNFACSQPLTCEEPLSLTRLIQMASPRMIANFQRVFNVMSGQRLPLGGMQLKDSILSSESGHLQLSAILQGNGSKGMHSFSWCENALESPCADPRPFVVEWDPSHPPRISATGLSPGLHLLIEVAQTGGLWLYGDHFAYVLVTDKANADHLRPRFESLRRELSGFDPVRARTLAVAFLASQI